MVSKFRPTFLSFFETVIGDFSKTLNDTNLIEPSTQPGTWLVTGFPLWHKTTQSGPSGQMEVKILSWDGIGKPDSHPSPIPRGCTFRTVTMIVVSPILTHSSFYVYWGHPRFNNFCVLDLSLTDSNLGSMWSMYKIPFNELNKHTVNWLDILLRLE